MKSIHQVLSILNSSIGLMSAFIISLFVFINFGNEFSVFFLGFYSIFSLCIAVYMNGHYAVISNKPLLIKLKDLIKLGGGKLFLLACFVSSSSVAIYLLYAPSGIEKFSNLELIAIFCSCYLFSLINFLNSKIYLSYDITFYNKCSIVNKFFSMMALIILSYLLDFSSFIISFVIVNLIFSTFVLLFYLIRKKTEILVKNNQQYDKFFSFKLSLITFSYFIVNKLMLVFLPSISFNGNKLVVAYLTLILSAIVGILASSRSYIVPELTQSWIPAKKIFLNKRNIIISQFKFIGFIYILFSILVASVILFLSEYGYLEINRITFYFILLSILIYYFELNSSSSTIMLNASGTVIYWKWAIFTAFLYLIALYIISLSYNITPIIMILIQFTSMAIYQYWKWPILLLSYSPKLPESKLNETELYK